MVGTHPYVVVSRFPFGTSSYSTSRAYIGKDGCVVVEDIHGTPVDTIRYWYEYRTSNGIGQETCVINPRPLSIVTLGALENHEGVV